MIMNHESQIMIGIPHRKAHLILVRLWFLVGVMLLLTEVEAAYPAEIRRSYEAEVPVFDKSEQTRNKAMRAALLKVMTKVSGQRELDRIMEDQVLEHAKQHVQQFRYRSELSVASDRDASSTDRLVFWARFDPVSVDKLLQKANIRTWGRTEPLMLIWLVVQDGEGRTLLGAEGHRELSDVLYASASERGISILLPLLDLDDQMRISEADVWNRSRERVLAASERYGTDTVLMGRVLPSHTSSSSWEAHWELLGDGITDDWNTYADGSKEILQEGIHEAIDILVTRYARSQQESTADADYDPVRLTVFGIGTINDYAKVWRYIEDLQPGTKVYVTEADMDRMSFQVSMPGGQAQFDKIVKRGATLAKMTLPKMTTASTGDVPAYQLLP